MAARNVATHITATEDQVDMNREPGGFSSSLTPHAITAIRAVDLMAQVRWKPVVLWPVFVMALHSSRVMDHGSCRR